MAGATTAARIAPYASPSGPAHATTRVVALQRFLDEMTEYARRAMIIATRRRAVRQQLHHFSRDHAIDKARSSAYAGDAPAVTFVKQLMRLWRAGANLSELMQLAAVPTRAVLSLAGGAPRALSELDVEETRLDGEEDVIQMRRRVHRETPAALREEAALCDVLEANAGERARALRFRADLLERTQGCVA